MFITMTLSLILGPMFSGKTSELIRILRRKLIAGKKCIIVRPTLDTRSENISTHDKISINAPVVRVNDASKDLPDCTNYDVIAVDEAQFIKNISAMVSANVDKKIYMAALHADFRLQMFPEITLLIPLANKIKFLTAVCSCGNDAVVSYRTTDEKEILVIGGADKYAAKCLRCYYAGGY